jgi:sugar/nucleoside kinase (ribokinase family)
MNDIEMQSEAQKRDWSNLLDPAAVAACRVVTGFDGFVDEMITLVAERQDLANYKAVENISDFAAMMAASAGHSSLREIIVRHVHPGGCAVNLADGLASLGVHVDCFATLGDPVHPAFASVVEKCHSVHSWGREPGRTLAFEFQDGKVMFSAGTQLADFTPEHVTACMQDGTYLKACQQAQVIALTDWTMYPHMTAVWEILRQQVFSTLSHRPHLFFDLVDPSSRCDCDVLGMLHTLALFEAHGEVTLGLNGNEANILSRLLDIAETNASSSTESTADQASGLREAIGISRVVIHRSRYAVSATAGEKAHAFSEFCAQPLKSTGAGDRFNAGFCLGLALSLNATQCLELGCMVAAALVSKGRSATLSELISN